MTATSLTIPGTSVETPPLSASTYASSIETTWPPVMYQYAPTTSANGNSANINGRSRGFFGASTVSDPGLGGGPTSFTSVSRLLGFKTLTSGDAAWPNGDASFAASARRASRRTMSSRTPAPSCGELVASFNLFSRLAMAFSFLSCNRRFACFGQVRFHCFERLQQAPSVVFGNAGQCLPVGDIAELTNLDQFGACRPHEMEKPCAAVSRMRAPFDQSQRLELVEDATERDRFDFEKLRESLLIDALVLREVG